VRLLRYWKIVLGLVLVFGAGTVSGIVGTHYFIKRGIERALNFEHWKAGVMNVLQSKLNLTSQQHEKIEELLDQHGREIHGTFSRTFNDCGHILVQLQRQIDQELTPQQRAIHEQMKQQFRAELKKKFNFDLPEE
jgi:hypothetical protein